VDHFSIQNAPVGILASGSSVPPLTVGANVNDVRITTSASQTAVSVFAVPSGQVNFYNMNITNSGRGLWVNDGAPDVKFQGKIVTTSSSDESVLVQSMKGGSVNVNTTTDTLATPVATNALLVSTAPLTITDTASAAPAAIQVVSNTAAIVNIGQTTITRPSQQGVLVQNNGATQTTFRNLQVTQATNEAFQSLSNDETSSLTINGRSSIESLSGTTPALTTNDRGNFDITLYSLKSSVPTTSGTAVLLTTGTTTPSNFKITNEFLVSGTAGTISNVVVTGTNTAVTVTLP